LSTASSSIATAPFLHAGGNAWNLSPAFDLNPNPSEGRKHLATAIDEADTTASVEALMSVAPFFRLDEEDVVDVLREVLGATSR
jgi:serine/threonine-protein kinase HipA